MPEKEADTKAKEKSAKFENKDEAATQQDAGQVVEGPTGEEAYEQHYGKQATAEEGQQEYVKNPELGSETVVLSDGTKLGAGDSVYKTEEDAAAEVVNGNSLLAKA